MKQEFMRIGGAKTEKEFYKMYPTEEAFLMKHGGAINKLMAKGGEAYPQTATMDNFFSYGVPVPPTYYRQGGAFPMAQSEEQFFSPFYGNVPNPYNKAMGGSSEAYPQSMSFPYGNTGRSTHFMMQDGGDMSEEQTLPKMGVNGKLLEFVGTIKNTAANKLNSNLATYGKVKNPEQYEFEQAKYGGNLKKYQSDVNSGDVSSENADVVSDKPAASNIYNYYYGYDPRQNQGAGQLPPEYYNDIDYMYGRRRPLSDFNIRGRGMAGNYRSTGWLDEEYGLDKLRNMGLTHVDQSNPKWYQFLKRPTKTYYFGQQGQQPQGSVPGQADQQGPAASTTGTGTPAGGTGTTSTTPQASGTGVTADKQTPPNQADPGKGMGFFGRLFNREGNIVPQAGTSTSVVPDQQVKGPDMINQRTKQMWNPEFTDWRNQHIQNRLGRMGEKIADLEAHKAWQRKQLDNPNIELSGWRGRQERRLLDRRDDLEKKMKRYKGSTQIQEFGGEQKKYQSKKTTGTVKTPDGREVPVNDHKFNETTTFKPSMTVEEYLKMKEDEVRRQEILRQEAEQEKYLRDLPTMNSVDEYLKNNPEDTPFVKHKDVTVGTPITEDPFRALPGADPMLTQPVGKSRVLSPMEQLYLDALKAESARAGVTNPQNISEADMRRIMEMTPSYRTGPEGFAYGGYTTYAKGGSYNAGDVVDMTPEELQRFIAMGGQVEFLD